MDKGLALDPTLCDAKYTKAGWYEDLGDYAKAMEVWNSLAVDLEQRGYTIEAEEPRKKAEKCRAKFNVNT